MKKEEFECQICNATIKDKGYEAQGLFVLDGYFCSVNCYEEAENRIEEESIREDAEYNAYVQSR